MWRSFAASIRSTHKWGQAMRTLYFDCFSGISGDMCLGALLDLGEADESAFLLQMSKLGLDEYTLNITKTHKNGICATDVTVRVHDAHACGGEEHSHGRRLADILDIIAQSGISPAAKETACKIFVCIARAEAKIHGEAVEDVHFHEVGAADSIADIVGTAVLLDMLGVEQVICSPVSEGHGFVHCRHGIIPVPVPATAQILAQAGAPVRYADIESELVTPTGAGIVASLASGFGALPVMADMKIGYGAGKKDFAAPNLLRVYLGDIARDGGGAAEEEIIVLQTNIDDMTAENTGFVMEELFAAGALDVFFTPVVMKKNRPAVKLSVLCKPGGKPAMEHVLFTHTATIGIRSSLVRRSVLPREMVNVSTQWGQIAVKASFYNGAAKYAPEYESVAASARRCGVGFDRVYTDAKAACANLSKP